MKSNKLSNFFKSSNINYVKLSKIYLAVIAALLVSAIIIISIIGMNLGFDFKGGTIIEVVYDVEFDENGNMYENGAPYDENLTKENVDEILNEVGGFEIASIQLADGDFGKVVVYKLLSNDKPTNEQLASIKTKLYEKFSEYNSSSLIQKNYISVYNVNETKSNIAMYASIALSVGIVLLAIGVLIRFGSSAAITSLITSIVNTLLIFAVVIICRITVNVAFIGSVLAIFALTLIANLIYFDKLRENQKNKDLSREEIANLSAKQSIVPNLLIFAVSLICTILLAGFGVVSIREFALPLLVGIFFVILSTTFMVPFLWKEIQFKRKKSGN